jgi:hypothetical protein
MALAFNNAATEAEAISAFLMARKFYDHSSNVVKSKEKFTKGYKIPKTTKLGIFMLMLLKACNNAETPFDVDITSETTNYLDIEITVTGTRKQTSYVFETVDDTIIPSINKM